jgi:hypothetical protein
MFSIDLLKGKGRPVKSDPKRAMLKVVPFLVPVIAMVAWAASYQQDCADIQAKKASIQKNQVIIDDAKQAVETYRRMSTQMTAVNKTLETITEGLSYRIQVTDLLVELVQTLPDETFIDEIRLDRVASMQKPSKQEGKDAKSHLLIQRKLKLTLCGFDPVQSDQQVRDYVSRLKASKVLADIFTDVKPAARRQGIVNQRPATFYEIECTIREQGE